MKYVIDTSVFVNPKARSLLGKTPKSAIKKFVKLIEKKALQVYMPPSVFKEIGNFADEEVMAEFEVFVRKRSPNLYTLTIPAALLHKFISEMRERMNRGMRVAEEGAKEKPSAQLVKKLREKYREAVRAGIVDSVEDLELVLLAKELNATLVSVDEGVERLADELGVERMAGDKFLRMLKRT